ncbi:helix-turn-helix domain-containing protein [Streptomyces sp. NPDC057280]|uniref:helix-turn-helix domain-containing protein n=1 Tax=Streptomyces sp. NPDC057280 TaxID=3346081 RepID=UPI0036439CDB
MRLAQRLREIRIHLGMTSEEIAKAIGISASHFSRILSGERLLTPKQLKSLHDLMASVTETEPPSKGELAHDWNLLQDTWDTDGPLPGHYCRAARALEHLEQQLAESVETADRLRAELLTENEHRQRVEGELNQLREQQEELTAEQQQRIRELTEERDHAIRRLDFLEDRLKQTEAMNRLLAMQHRAVNEVVYQAEVEVARWRQEPEPSRNEHSRVSHAREMQQYAEELHNALEKSENSAIPIAYNLLNGYAPEQFAEVWENLHSWGYWADAKWLIQEAVNKASAWFIVQASKAGPFGEDGANILLWALGRRVNSNKIEAAIEELRRENREGGAQRLIKSAAAYNPEIVRKYLRQGTFVGRFFKSR